ncbi:hypothetical protein [Nocardia suismassiliense]|uniref:hypothetical protein n=1 Tax=Nocardia suismassiliense TaxID=2077092 RepID=UPI00131F46E6|nr:hypothetical protein [Nocardia suismassiliense]
MSGEPGEDLGKAVQQNVWQSFQTATMVAGLFQRRAGDARSRTEFLQRMRIAANKEERSAVEHWLRVEEKLATVPQQIELNTAKIEEVKQRTTNATELHKEELRRTKRQIDRSDKDLERRDKAGELDSTHKQAIHDKQVAAYDNRETRARELHKLDKDYKALLIEIRRRAAGLSDTLTDHGGKNSAAGASTAAHAAAQASEGLSEEHAEAARAYGRRFTEDTGVEPHDFIDGTVVADTKVPVDDAIDAEVVENFDPATPAAQGSTASRVFIADTAGLAEALTVLTHLEHEFAGASEDSDSPAADGTGYDAAVADTQPPYERAAVDPDAGLDFGFDPPLALPAAPDPELGP